MIVKTARQKFRKQRLGEILINRNLLNENQLYAALRIQKKEPDYFGKTLIRMGFVSDHDIVIALGIQSHLPYIAIDKCPINKNVVSLVSREFAQKHHLIILDKVGNVLSVVSEAPLDDALRDELQKRTQCQIASFLATRNEIDRAIAIGYD